VAASENERAIEAAWRLERPRVVAGLTRLVRDLAVAEDLAHDALVAALQQWPTQGIPRNPGAWLMAAGKRRAIDALRRRTRWARKHEELARDLEAGRPDSVSDLEAAMDDDIGDDLLRLMFTACHPVLSTEARTALTLRLLGGLTTDEIARAFLVPEPTIAQRIVRAKRTLARARVPFEVPRGPGGSGCRPSSGHLPRLQRGLLGDGGGRLGPAGPNTVALRPRPGAGRARPRRGTHLALMELQSSRLRARVGPSGEAVRLLEQDRPRWDQLFIGRGLAGLRRAESLGSEPGPYQLQAAIAACHARARRPGDTDWALVARLYARLIELTGSPIVRLNHAVAVGMAEGPAAGLALVDALMTEGELASYHHAPSVRGDLLEKLGRFAEARAEFGRAAGLTRNARERDLLVARARACATATAAPRRPGRRAE
jgi:RNA polymerase sigma factor (sigma-70 family)